MKDFVRAGLVGCGNISKIYLNNLTGFLPYVKIVRCYDINKLLMEKSMRQYGIEGSVSLEHLLVDSNIDMIICLTPPVAHYDICRRALLRGKHVYVEKTMAANFEQGISLFNLAKQEKLFLGCAPDTFLGTGLQTVKSMLKQETYGKPIACMFRMSHRGIESWHPQPDFCYQKEGGGPDFGMGPYYFTNLVELFGSVTEVTAFAGAAYPFREAKSREGKKRKIAVEAPTHLTGSVKFENGVMGTFLFSYDIGPTTLPNIEIYTTGGTIRGSDPNCFGGEIYFGKENSEIWTCVKPVEGFYENCRGLGASEMARCILEGRPHQSHFANPIMGLHVLEILKAIRCSAETGASIPVYTRVKRNNLFDSETFSNLKDRGNDFDIH